MVKQPLLSLTVVTEASKILALITDAASDHNRTTHRSFKPYMYLNPFSLFPDGGIIFKCTLISIICGVFHPYVDVLLFSFKFI